MDLLEAALDGRVLSFGRETLLPLALALLLGGILGWEREASHKPAGFRTHVLVCLGAASFTLVTLAFHERALAAGGEVTRSDPLRLVAGVIGGIGFLGAGSILRRESGVEGLTTAGNIWLTGAVGVACGASLFGIAAATVAFALLTLTGLDLLERRAGKKSGPSGGSS